MTLRRRVLSALAITGTLLVAAALFVSAIAEWAAERAVAGAGYGPADLTLESLSLDRVVIRDISIAGGTIKAKSVEAHFDLLEALGGHLRSLSIVDPAISIAWRGGRIEPAIGGNSSSSAETAFKIDAFTVSGGTASLDLAVGRIGLTYAAALQDLSDDGWKGDLQASGSGQGLTLTAVWSGAFSSARPTESAGSGHVALALKSFALPGLFRDMNGSLRVAVNEDRAGSNTAPWTVAADVSAGLVDANAGSEVSLAVTSANDALAIKASISNLKSAGVEAGAVALDGKGTWHRSNAQSEFVFEDLSARITDVRSAAAVVTTGVTLALDPASGHGQKIALARDGEMKLVADLGLKAEPIIVLPNGAHIGLLLPAIDVTGPIAITGGETRLVVRGHGAAITHAAGGLDVPEIEATWDGETVNGKAAAQLVAGPDSSLTGLATRPKPAAKLAAAFATTAKGLKASADVLTAGGIKVGTLSFDQSADGWRALLEVRDLTVGAGGVAWAELFGPLVDLQDATGRFSLAADARGRNGETSGTASLTAQDFNFELAQVPFAHFDAKIELDRIWPPHAAQTQPITFKKIGAAVPLENGAIGLRFPGDGSIVIDAIAADIAGGKISGSGVLVAKDETPPMIPVVLEDIDLSRLLTASQVAGLSGSGLLNGRLPLTYQGGKLLVADGSLTSAKGVIQYRPETTPAAVAAGGAIVAQALANFQYEQLRTAVSGDLLQELKISVALKGKNPDLFNGYPVEFNLNLEGPLARIAATGLSTSQIPGELGGRVVTKPPQ